MHPSIVFEQPSCIVNGTLHRYQLEGFSWLSSLYIHKRNGILADEMGLGKTIQTIAFLGWIKEYEEELKKKEEPLSKETFCSYVSPVLIKTSDIFICPHLSHKQFIKHHGPHIIIAPKFILANWAKEFKKWCPMFRVITLLGTKAERALIIKKYIRTASFDVILTSFDVAVLEKRYLMCIPFVVCIIDEAHRLKNVHSEISTTIKQFKRKSTILLTGTPLQNNLTELWSLLNFIDPVKFDDYEKFLSDIDGIGEKKEIEKGREEEAQKQTKRTESAGEFIRNFLAPYMLRRTKNMITQPPPKTEYLVPCPLTKLQRKMYRNILEDMSGGAKLRLLNIVMQLKKVCNHPYIFPGVEPEPHVEGEHLVSVSGKMKVLDIILKKSIKDGNKVLVFSQMTKTLDLIELYLEMRGWDWRRIDGSTEQSDRARSIGEFNADTTVSIPVFILSTRAGGLGINLYSASTVVIYDSDWNPQVDLQAMDRAHRIGQVKHVHVYRLYAENTLEEKVLERARTKLRLDQLVIKKKEIEPYEKKKPVIFNTIPSDHDELLSIITHCAEDILTHKKRPKKTSVTIAREIQQDIEEKEKGEGKEDGKEKDLEKKEVNSEEEEKKEQEEEESSYSEDDIKAETLSIDGLLERGKKFDARMEEKIKELLSDEEGHQEIKDDVIMSLTDMR
ncbi:ISWI chromatin-remodeling complex ATPase ISW2 [Aduncisulcus paluster]|uniref:ISWI chromatin-remodeling complex ATPase ISW2 n=1 Tax=Aduncisulcus paluster TaxID=2918883 RepID=A0ABQ5K0I1_9EUKA|nr:ISWI chromatin-remodeling complex ATPase ISW2 [Aduncisulcus paluster]